MRMLLLLLLLLPASAAQALGLEETLPPAQEARAIALFKQLRCVVCTSESLYDSNVPLAVDLRHAIRRQIAEGASDAEIMNYVIARYGDEILFKPPLVARTWFLWGLPLFGLAVGVMAVTLMFRRQKE